MLNATFKIIFLIEVISITAIRSFYTLGKEPIPKKRSLHSNTDRIFMILEIIGMIIPLVYVFTSTLDFANYNSPVWVNCAGSIIFFFGILLLWRAHFDIGRFWVMDLSIMENHKLIKTGVYKYIRHPLYASHMIWAIAQVLIFNNWIAGCSFIIVFIPHYFYRVTKEEKMMISEFGDEYNKYINETGRLFPKFKK